MILGLSIPAFTSLHVALSLVGMLAGAIVVVGMWATTRLDGWTRVFFVTTVLTTVTGYFFPSSSVTPAQIVGVISLLVLLLALSAFYVFRLKGRWRWIYVITAMAALYLNVFVGVVQSFQKLPWLQPLAPTQSEPPFVVTQLIVMAAFIVAGIFAVVRFHPAQPVLQNRPDNLRPERTISR